MKSLCAIFVLLTTVTLTLIGGGGNQDEIELLREEIEEVLQRITFPKGTTEDSVESILGEPPEIPLYSLDPSLSFPKETGGYHKIYIWNLIYDAPKGQHEVHVRFHAVYESGVLDDFWISLEEPCRQEWVFHDGSIIRKDRDRLPVFQDLLLQAKGLQARIQSIQDTANK